MRPLGSLTLGRSLLRAGLVDRFRVVVFPVITGASGRDRSYDGYPDVASTCFAAGPLTVGCSCWSTGPRCWPGRPAHHGRRLTTPARLLCRKEPGWVRCPTQTQPEQASELLAVAFLGVR